MRRSARCPPPYALNRALKFRPHLAANPKIAAQRASTSRRSLSYSHAAPVQPAAGCRRPNRQKRRALHPASRSFSCATKSSNTAIALAHKLVRTIFCVLVRRKPYRDSTVDYEAASVAKNAPRWIRALKKYGYWPQVATPNAPITATASS
jgi:hypothetical protein